MCGGGYKIQEVEVIKIQSPDAFCTFDVNVRLCRIYWIYFYFLIQIFKHHVHAFRSLLPPRNRLPDSAHPDNRRHNGRSCNGVLSMLIRILFVGTALWRGENLGRDCWAYRTWHWPLSGLFLSLTSCEALRVNRPDVIALGWGGVLQCSLRSGLWTLSFDFVFHN